MRARHVAKWPAEGDVPEDLPGRILYNLTWVDEVEYDELGHRAVYQRAPRDR
jgi:hypothetical protein